jgi:hypothetical protein
MTIRLALLLLILAGCGGNIAPPAPIWPHTESPCAPAAAVPEWTMNRIRAEFSSGRDFARDMRRRYGVPRIPVDSVLVETDPLTCARAHAIYVAGLATALPADQEMARHQPVVVIRGGRFLRVYNPEVRAGEFVVEALIDWRWRIRGWFAA